MIFIPSKSIRKWPAFLLDKQSLPSSKTFNISIGFHAITNSNIGLQFRSIVQQTLWLDTKQLGKRCNLERLKVTDLFAAGMVKERASVLQSKTSKPIRFEIAEGTQSSIANWISHPLMSRHDYLRPNRFHDRSHISNRQYAQLLKR